MAPAPAAAGAWLAEEGGQEIWTTAVGERDETWAVESSAYWEIPVFADTSFVGAPWFEQNPDTIDGWRAEAAFGLKRGVLRWGQSAMAVQAGALWTSHPPLGCDGAGGELRWLGARSFGDGAAFVNLEAAGRVLGGGCEDQRFDLTFGYRPVGNWLGLGQLFLEAPQEGEDRLKLQVTVVRFRDDGRGLQMGLRGRIDGGAPETALVIGFWGQPRN